MTQPIDGYRPRRTEDSDETTTPTQHAPLRAPNPTARHEPGAWEHAAPVSDRDQAALGEVARNMLAAPRNDDVLYAGVNVSGEAPEIAILRAHAHVTVVGDATEKGVYESHGQRFDLRSTEGRHAFAASLAVDTAKTRAVEALLGGSEADKAKLAGLVETFAKGERGEPIPSRLVLSGHSSAGLALYDQSSKNGTIVLSDVRAAARIFPRGSAQVEDIHIAGCSTANNVTLQLAEWRAAFPSLKSIWSHDGTAPLSGGAELGEWERKSRGHTGTMTPDVATMKRDHAAAWSIDGGLKEGLSIDQIRENVQETEPWFDEKGNLIDTHDPRANARWADKAYRAFRSLSQSAEATPTERAHGKERADFLFNLLHPAAGH